MAWIGCALLPMAIGVAAEEYCDPWQPPAPPAVAIAAEAAVPAPPPAVAVAPAAPRLPPTAFTPTGADGIGPSLIFLGDSLTEGAGATAPEFAYPALVAGARAFTVYASAGQTSTVLSSIFKGVDLPEDAVVIIWMGRNNFRDTAVVLHDIANTVEQIGDRHYLVLGMISGRYYSEQPGREGFAAMSILNGALAAAYPHNFVPLGDDLLCSDRVDAIHLGDDGQRKIADTVGAAIAARGW